MLQKSEEYLKANPNFGKVLFYPKSIFIYNTLEIRFRTKLFNIFFGII